MKKQPIIYSADVAYGLTRFAARPFGHGDNGGRWPFRIVSQLDGRPPFISAVSVDYDGGVTNVDLVDYLLGDA